MKEIELSSMVEGKYLEFESFEQQTSIKVRHKAIDWPTGWNQILQYAIYQKGPDCSEVGSTWLQNLDDMHGLRPLSHADMEFLGGEESFLPNAWPNEPSEFAPSQRLSVPWLLETRLITYRRDLLAQANINEADAFATPEAMFETLSRLKACGIEYPLAMMTSDLSIHNMASFVWGRGGNFRSPDYHKVLLVEPEARHGLFDYFRLHPFIRPPKNNESFQPQDEYLQGRAAVLLYGLWAMRFIKDRQDFVAPVVQENSGFAKIPGVPYIGSTHLITWRYTLSEQPVLHLIKHLTSPKVLHTIFLSNGNFPARVEALKSPPLSTDPDYQLVIDCLMKGRTFRSAHLWAGVEMRLNSLHDQLWNDLFANPELDLKAEIEQRVRQLANRLERTILASW